MSQTQTSLCSLTLQQADLLKLQQLDPFQSDGFQSEARVPVPIRIVFNSQSGKQTADQQTLTLQVLTRWVRPQASKNKDAKPEPVLEAMRVYVTSQDDIFLNMVSKYTYGNTALKTKNQLNIAFKDFPKVLIGMLDNCGQGQGRNTAQLRLSYQGGGRLVLLQKTQYKVIELIDLYLVGNSVEKTNQSIIYRYNYNKSKLAMIQNSIDSIYRLLATKNAPLLAYIQKTIGDQV